MPRDAPRNEKGARNGCTEEKEVSLGRDESCPGTRGIAPRSERDGAAGGKGCTEKRCGVRNGGAKEQETTRGCVELHR